MSSSKDARQRERHRKGRPGILLLLPLVLLVTIFGCAQVSLLTVRPDELDVVIGPRSTADYNSWERVQFRPVDPMLGTLLAQDGNNVQPLTPVSVAQISTDTLTPSGATPETNAPTASLEQPAATASPSHTASQTSTDTPTVTTTRTLTPSATNTLTPTASRTPTGTATQTQTRTATGAATQTATRTATVTATQAATPSPTRTATPTWIAAPVAGFIASPTTGTRPLTVTFSNTSTGAITSYLWSFGDGFGFSSQMSPIYTYTNAGTYLVTLTVFGPGGSSFSNTVIFVAAPPPPPIPTATNTPTPTATSAPRADLSVSKIVNSPAPTVGDTITYTITVVNNGPDPASNVIVNDAFSGAAVSIVSVTSSQGGCTAFPCTLGAIPFPGSATITIVVTTNASGSVINDASLTSITFDPNGANNAATLSIPVSPPPSADLMASKTVSNTSPNEGTVIIYSITVTNNGPNNATGVQITDVLPIGVTYQSDDGGGAYNSGGGVWTVGNLANGANITLNITARVNAGTSGSTIPNTASITAAAQPDPNSGNNSAAVSITPQLGVNVGLPDGAFYTITCGSSLIVDLGATPVVTHPGYDLVYYERPAGGIILLDWVVVEVGANMTGPWFEVFNWGNGIVDANTNIGQAGYGSFGEPANQLIPMTNPPLYGTAPFITGIAIDVDARAPAGVYRWVRLAAAPSCVGNDAEVDALQALPPATADLSIAKVDNVDPATVGDTIIYTITVANNGPDPADNVIVNDTFSGAAVSVISVTPSQGGCMAFPCNLGTVSSLSSAFITVTVTANAAGAIVNDVNVTSSATDPNGANNAATQITTVNPPLASADLSITKTDNLDPVTVGDTVTYTITLTNNGPDSADNVIVNDTFSGAAVSVISVTPSQGGCIAFPCNLGAIPFPGSASITVMVTANAAGVIINNADVFATTADPNGANNTAMQPTGVNPLPSADLVMSKTVSNPTPSENDTITYTLVVSNIGPAAATGVQITDTWPGGVTYQSDDSGGTYNSGTGLWDVGILATGANATLNITATVNVGATGSTIPNTAAITAAGQADPDGSNNSATVNIVVQ
jgi:uncharacterized repeat protein (TIGR01451 family)